MPKLLFFSLLVVYTLAATLQVGGSPTTAQSPKPLLVDAMVTIPVNNLNSNSQYIRSLV